MRLPGLGKGEVGWEEVAGIVTALQAGSGEGS